METNVDKDACADRLLRDYMDSMFAASHKVSDKELVPLFNNAQQLVRTVKVSDFDHPNYGELCKALAFLTSIRLLNSLVVGTSLHRAVMVLARQVSEASHSLGKSG